ncbi:MAG: DUF2442 domain-containing protein [Saprospiraceae bacterium]|nr:DUF2442 domain-containing protein [Saprospiraceae bacterium]
MPGITYSIVEAIPIEKHKLIIRFDDGLKKIIDIKPFIKIGISSALLDIEYFKKVKVIDGFITWENGFDFCHNFLYNYDPHDHILTEKKQPNAKIK